MDTAIIDCETTNADAATAQIVELSIKVIDDKGKCISNKSKRYKPFTAITKEASEVTGITNADVKDCPPFKEDAKKIAKLLKGKNIVGYNLLRFDIPVIAQELDRSGEVLEITGEIIDVMILERQLHPGTLAAVYERYTGKALKGAHGASADVDGTQVVLAHQITELAENGQNVDEWLKKAGRDPKAADWFNKLKYDEEGYLVYNFGKHPGKRVKDEKQYALWILGENFPQQVKDLINNELKKEVQTQFKKTVTLTPAPENKKGFHPIKKNNNFKRIDDDEETPF